MSEEEKPLFLEPLETLEQVELPPPSNASVLPSPEHTLPDPEKPLTPRHKEFCRLVALGKTGPDIERILGYTQAWTSTLKANWKIREYIDELQERIFDRSVDERVKDLTGPAMDVVEEAIKSEKLEMKDRVMQARWLIEKATGKPAQQVNTTGDISIGIFMDKLDAIQSRGKTLSDAIDITPDENLNEKPKLDKVDKWIKENL